MTTTSRPPETTGADPWWGFDDQVRGDAPIATAVAPSRSPRRRRPVRTSLPARAGWIAIGLLVAPIDLLRRLLARSPRLRRLAIRAIVVLAILAILASSVGVILINNVVIGRTAELGELDERRRELRRENALLGAQAARLSSPDVVFRRASRELGMVPTKDVPKFIYLVRASHTLTPYQRRKRIEAGGTSAGTAAIAATPATTPTAAPARSAAPAATPVASASKEDG